MNQPRSRARARPRARAVALLVLGGVGCTATQAVSPPAEDALVANVGSVATVRAKLHAAGTIRVLKVTSQSAFEASGPLASTCSILPGNAAGGDPHAQQLMHFNRASIDGDTFSVEVPRKIDGPAALCGFERRLDSTVLDVTVLSDTGVRFTVRIPVELGGRGTTAVTVVPQADGTRLLARPVKVADQTQLDVQLAALPAEPTRAVGNTSFAESWDRVMAERVDVFPDQIGASDLEISTAISGNAVGRDTRSLRLRRDQTRILSDVGDEKTRGVKAFHPFGVCSKARWQMDAAPTGFSGLFREGTDVDAIVRMSAGGNNETTTPTLGLIHRLFGVAIKLFPGQDQNTRTETQNIVLFDDKGPSGNDAPWFLLKKDGQTTNFFSNWVFGDDPLTNGNVAMFHQSIVTPRFVPLTPIGVVRNDGSFERASAVRTPKFVKLVPIGPDGGLPRAVPQQPKMRDELVQYEDGEINFEVRVFDDSASDGRDIASKPGKRVGVLTQMTKPIVSTYCDQAMQFHHAPQ